MSDQTLSDKYTVVKTLSQSGGMGSIYLVQHKKSETGEVYALKTCKLEGDEVRRRFKREVRILQQFAGNSKVVQILDTDLDAEPPAFLMAYYKDGDLSLLKQEIASDFSVQEDWFGKMIDCVISDLGLCVEHESSTVFTHRSQSWVTEGYAPPEFAVPGGFASATEQSDIYMLGKTFYSLLSGRDPRYLTEEGMHPALWYIIDKCCKHSPDIRFKNLAALKQSLRSAYDLLLKRADAYGMSNQFLEKIVERLKSENKYFATEVAEFIDALMALGDGERDQIIRNMPDKVFSVLALNLNEAALDKFLPLYLGMLERLSYPDFSYAETVARQMREIVRLSDVPASRMEALRIAEKMAAGLNRYDAMDTCKTIVGEIEDDGFAFLVSEFIRDNADSFLVDIESYRCKHPAIRSAIQQAKNSKGQ